MVGIATRAGRHVDGHSGLAEWLFRRIPPLDRGGGNSHKGWGHVDGHSGLAEWLFRRIPIENFCERGVGWGRRGVRRVIINY